MYGGGGEGQRDIRKALFLSDSHQTTSDRCFNQLRYICIRIDRRKFRPSLVSLRCPTLEERLPFHSVASVIIAT